MSEENVVDTRCDFSLLDLIERHFQLFLRAHQWKYTEYRQMI